MILGRLRPTAQHSYPPMKATLGQVRELLREAQEGPDAELRELVEETVQSLIDKFGRLEIMDEHWKFVKRDGRHEFNVTVGDEVAGYGNTRLLKDVVDSVSGTMTMVTGSPDVKVQPESSVSFLITSDDFFVHVFEDWDEAPNEEDTLHFVFVSIRRVMPL